MRCHQRFQSTLPARGATSGWVSLHRPRSISIHAPRTGSDTTESDHRIFLHISIHAPRTGSDLTYKPNQDSVRDFNPRSPHGERRQDDSGIIRIDAFQSTLPARGATNNLLFHVVTIRISIHAPRTGSDEYYQGEVSVRAIFQSTLPARGATTIAISTCGTNVISIHAPRTGSDPSPA